MIARFLLPIRSASYRNELRLEPLQLPAAPPGDNAEAVRDRLEVLRTMYLTWITAGKRQIGLSQTCRKNEMHPCHYNC